MDLFLPEWAPFTVALIVMLAIGAIEVVALLMGFSPSAAVESALPEVDLPDLDIAEIDVPDLPDGVNVPDGAAAVELGPLSAVLSWLSVGRVPLLVLLVIFLTAFALSGYAVQGIAVALLGTPVNAWLAAIPALAGAAYACRHLGRWLGRILPRDHSEAASQRDLIGSYATIIRGEARQGQPAEAKTHDLRGRSHYVLIEPNEAGTTYAAGDRVFIVGRTRNVYRAITRIAPQEG